MLASCFVFFSRNNKLTLITKITQVIHFNKVCFLAFYMSYGSLGTTERFPRQHWLLKPHCRPYFLRFMPETITQFYQSEKKFEHLVYIPFQWFPLIKPNELTGRGLKSQHRLCFFYILLEQGTHSPSCNDNPSSEYFVPHGRPQFCPVLASFNKRRKHYKQCIVVNITYIRRA